MRNPRVVLASVSMAVVAIAAVALAACAHQSGKGPEGVTPQLRTRSCGYFAIGKGWHLSATQNVTCRLARMVVRRFFVRCVAAQRDAGRVCSVTTYRCTETYREPDIGYVRCTRPHRLITAKSVT
jgi:hypothetical protein